MKPCEEQYNTESTSKPDQPDEGAHSTDCVLVRTAADSLPLATQTAVQVKPCKEQYAVTVTINSPSLAIVPRDEQSVRKHKADTSNLDMGTQPKSNKRKQRLRQRPHKQHKAKSTPDGMINQRS